jgi:hypothetical protein
MHPAPPTRRSGKRRAPACSRIEPWKANIRTPSPLFVALSTANVWLLAVLIAAQVSSLRSFAKCVPQCFAKCAPLCAPKFRFLGVAQFACILPKYFSIGRRSTKGRPRFREVFRPSMNGGRANPDATRSRVWARRRFPPVLSPMKDSNLKNSTLSRRTERPSAVAIDVATGALQVSMADIFRRGTIRVRLAQIFFNWLRKHKR